MSFYISSKKYVESLEGKEIECKKLGAQIRNKRKHAHESQEELAAMVRSTKATISKLENGKLLSFDLLAEIANYYQEDIHITSRERIQNKDALPPDNPLVLAVQKAHDDLGAILQEYQ